MYVSSRLDARGNTGIPEIPSASVSQVVRPQGANQQASQISQLCSSIMKAGHLDPVTHLDPMYAGVYGHVRMCM